jgi:S1-C subfamily serine protease
MRQFLTLLSTALAGGLVSALLVIQLVGRADPAPSTFYASRAPAPVFAAERTPELPALPTPIDLRAAARLALPAVVHIKAATRDRQREAVKAIFSDGERSRELREGEGSGVIYTSNGYVITNLHVVEGANEITVTTVDRHTYPASLVGEDAKSDLAVLRIEGKNLPYLELADSDAAEPGQWVLAVGNPLGLTSTVTAGIISAKGRSISLLPDLDAIESFLQTDAAVNPGNSGGALVTAEGKLLGINTAIATKTGKFQGYSFAIPINLVQRIADDIIEFGAYRRAFLGVEISTFTRSDQRRLGTDDLTEGVVIDAIFAGGSAEAAGLLVDDLIVRAAGRTIRDLPDLTEIIGRAKVGETLNMTVVRNGTELEVVVSLVK